MSNRENQCLPEPVEVMVNWTYSSWSEHKLINRESNVLLLDEPTNHLDVDAKDELKRALKEYKGSILLICHEPEFYEGLATDVWDCKEWALKLS